MRKIEKFVKENNINLIDVAFLDLCGETRQITIPKQRLKDALKYGLKCDGSSISCVNKIDNSDTRLFLDENSYYLLPNSKLLVFCWTDSKFDARKNLYDLQSHISKDGTVINFGAELEFFLFKQKNGKPDFNSTDKLKYINPSFDEFELCLSDIANFCSDKINLEAVHHECGINQYEIDFKYDTPLKTADKIVFIKRVIKYFASKYNLIACFMPKPLNNISGSGMHINMSVFKNDVNLFYDETDKNHLSDFAYNYIKNIFRHISAISAFANPLVNSYKRLNSGFEAPTSVEYSASNRSVLMRIPKATKKTTRVELRSPDVSCNPYITFLAVLLAGFENIFDFKSNVKTPKNLPRSLFDAINFLKKDELLNRIVPQSYIDKKLIECETFNNQVTNFDLEQYFDI